MTCGSASFKRKHPLCILTQCTTSAQASHQQQTHDHFITVAFVCILPVFFLS
jgi:hypothetical protein